MHGFKYKKKIIFKHYLIKDKKGPFLVLSFSLDTWSWKSIFMFPIAAKNKFSAISMIHDMDCYMMDEFSNRGQYGWAICMKS